MVGDILRHALESSVAIIYKFLLFIKTNLSCFTGFSKDDVFSLSTRHQVFSLSTVMQTISFIAHNVAIEHPNKGPVIIFGVKNESWST